MLDHPILDIALGLIAFYVLFSLVASAIQEWIASLCGLRSRTLRSGIENLVDNADEIKQLLRHLLLRRLAKQKTFLKRLAVSWPSLSKVPVLKGLIERQELPSYISPATMSTALLDTFDKEHTLGNAKNAADLGVAVNAITGHDNIKTLLTPLLDSQANTVDDLKKRLADSFDETMDRVSGWYKRRAQLLIVLIAFVLTVLLNADTGQVARELWRHDALRAAVVAQATVLADTPPTQLQGPQEDAGTQSDNSEGDETDSGGDTRDGDAPDGVADARPSDNPAGDAVFVQNLSQLESFPIGWEIDDKNKVVLPKSLADWISRILGWLLTVAAVSLGAPFWFDLLTRVAKLRAAGNPVQK